jgi:4-diphosphocytidyl-2C-methyl-D-erythritol kinase
MHATVRIYSGANDLADALVERKDEVKQIISEIDGFKAYYLVRTSDGATSISVYDNEAGAEQSNRVAAAWVAENLPDLRITAPQISAGEVAISF